ncbi:hypothetical protein Cgig2_015229 [Carnegiea gigantea]|uniref:Uncharacterized protein n=1 Tax=Carnegiea gigantea TaxID=171969 RepID=A0A9Q1QJF6_9CARY|nr:hypothetical protein Cgig2_015229 [Carnegiea gigantea]
MKYGFVRFRSKEEVRRQFFHPVGSCYGVTWRNPKSCVTLKGRFVRNNNHSKWKWIPKRRLVVDISPIKNDFDEVNVTHNSQEVVGLRLVNTQANKVAHDHENVHQHHFGRVDQEVSSKASGTLFLPIGTAKTHPTYIGKLITQKKKKKTLVGIVVVSESSTNDIEEPTYFISRRQPMSPDTKKISNTKEKVQESTRQDSPALQNLLEKV